MNGRSYVFPSQLDPTLLRDFQEESSELLFRAAAALTSLEQDPRNREALDEAFRAFHSLKGIASLVGFTPIADLAHKTESCLESLRRGGEIDTAECIKLALAALSLAEPLLAELSLKTQQGRWNESAIYSDVVAHLNYWNDRFANSPGNRPKSVQPTRIFDLIEQTELMADALRRVPVVRIFQRMKRYALSLALKLDKRIEVRMDGGDIEMSAMAAKPLTRILIQLVRNSVDHGIERPEVRLASGKNECGVLSLAALRHDDLLQITVTDDGRGIPAKQLKDVWTPGFTTASRTTETSGRGVGLDIVRNTVESCGGSINLSSVSSSQTTVTLTLPVA